MSENETISFNSLISEVGSFAKYISNTDIKNETMFFNSDLNFAYKHGGKITRDFIDNLPEDWKKDVVFDSRVHMLMKGWYPAIPGFHHDDVPRPDIPVGQHFITAGQPDYRTPKYNSQHIIGLVNASICPTVFATGDITLPMVNEDELVYRKWHPLVIKAIEEGKLNKVLAEDRKLIHFDCNTFHTGDKANSAGWRWFGRVSKNTDRINKITNEIRINAQVYLEFPMEGW